MSRFNEPADERPTALPLASLFAGVFHPCELSSAASWCRPDIVNKIIVYSSFYLNHSRNTTFVFYLNYSRNTAFVRIQLITQICKPVDPSHTLRRTVHLTSFININNTPLKQKKPFKIPFIPPHLLWTHFKHFIHIIEIASTLLSRIPRDLFYWPLSHRSPSTWFNQYVHVQCYHHRPITSKICSASADCSKAATLQVLTWAAQARS